jgi:hypothetical protein
MMDSQPLGQNLDQTPVLRQAPKRVRSTGCCNKLYIDDDGVVSLSLRDMSIFGCLLVTVFLVYIGYVGCTTGQAVCNDDHFPMISDFLKMPFYDRIFCLLTTFLCLTCMSGNIRVVYSVLAVPSQQAGDWQNDVLLVCGIVASFALPLVGYFDEDSAHTTHVICAMTFFVGYTVYAFWVCSLMNKYKAQLTPAQQATIPALNKATAAITAAVVSFATSYVIYGTAHPYFAYLEWTVTILLLNFFLIVSFDNDFYSSVKEEKDE